MFSRSNFKVFLAETFSAVLSLRLGIVLFTFLAFGFGWYFLVPQKPEVNQTRQYVADTAINKIVEEIRSHRKEIRSIAVLHLANDNSDYVTTSLRERLSNTGVLDVANPPFTERLKSLLKLRNESVYSISEAVAYGKKENLHWVLTGRIDNFENVPNGAILRGQLTIVDIPSGTVAFSIKIDEDTSRSLRGFLINSALDSSNDTHGWLQTIPWYFRTLCFVLIALLLPVGTITFIRTMIAKKSNKINAFMLSIYTVIDAILAFFMIGGTFGSGGIVLIFLIAIIAAFIYNVKLMTLAARLEH